METLKQKYEAMLEFQSKIDSLEEKMQRELDNLKKEKAAMIRKFNAPVIQSIVGSISSFLAKKFKATGEDSFDIETLYIRIKTGAYESGGWDMSGAEGDIFQDAEELKLDKDGQVLIGYRHYCYGDECGAHDEKITERLPVLHRIAQHLETFEDIQFEVSLSSLILNGDWNYYRKRYKETDERCNEFGKIKIRESAEEILPNEFEGYHGFEESLIVPDGVVQIGKDAFKDCKGITAVILPEGLTNIGNGAFKGCVDLEKLFLPKSLRSIGSKAFCDCRSLKCINLPDGLETIGKNAFLGVQPFYVSYGKIRLNAAEIGLDKKTLLIDRTSDAPIDFSYRKAGLEDVRFFAIPDGVKTVDDSVFPPDLDDIWEVYIPDSVISIQPRVFSEDRGVGSVSVSLGNATYDSRNNCNAIIEKSSNQLIVGCGCTVIPDSVTSIGEGAFSGCYGLTKIHIPDSVTSIGEGAFSRCHDLSKIYIPEGVTRIADFTFYDCHDLREINIPDGVTSIGKYAFRDCNMLFEINLPNSVTNIGEGAFLNCVHLEIQLPASVTSIGDFAFIRCHVKKSQ